jgi:hypothetical protein
MMAYGLEGSIDHSRRKVERLYLLVGLPILTFSTFICTYSNRAEQMPSSYAAVTELLRSYGVPSLCSESC